MKLTGYVYEFNGERIRTTSVENLWQFSKVWEGELGEDGVPTAEFFTRRRKGWRYVTELLLYVWILIKQII